MWLLIIEIIAAIIAAIRGWGIWPLLILVGTIIFGLLFSPFLTYENFAFMQIIDYIATGILVIMAIVGRKPKTSSTNISQSSLRSSHSNKINRVKCPYCAELIMSEAKICRYCGSNIPE